MATTINLTASLNALLSFTNTKASDISVPTETLKFPSQSQQFTYGVGVNQAHYGWSDQFTLAPATTMGIDLFDLAISGGAAANDGLGRAVTTAKIKALCIAMANATPAAGDRLQIDGGNTAAGWTSMFKNNGSATTMAATLTIPGLEIGPDGVIIIGNPSAAGYAVVDTTNHLLRATNPGATTIAFDIAFLATNS